MQISKIIFRIVHDNVLKEDKDFLEKTIKELVEQGAEKVLLACTDLGELIKNNSDTIDSTSILIDTIKEKMNVK